MEEMAGERRQLCESPDQSVKCNQSDESNFQLTFFKKSVHDCPEPENPFVVEIETGTKTGF
jgi:hypothetical protein